MKVTGTANIGIKIKVASIDCCKDDPSVEDVCDAINKIVEIPQRISSIVDDMYGENYFLKKKDFALVKQYLKDEGIYPRISSNAFCLLIGTYSNIPQYIQPTIDSLADMIIIGTFPNWRIFGNVDPKEEIRLLGIGTTFHELWKKRLEVEAKYSPKK